MSVRDAVIVSTARTPIGRAYHRRVQRNPRPHSCRARHSRRRRTRGHRTGRDRGRRHGGGAAAGRPVRPIGRTAALRAGPRFRFAGMSIDRQCSSGLMAIATAAKQVIVDRMDVCVAGGVEIISMVQTPEMRIASRSGTARHAQARLHADDRIPPRWSAALFGQPRTTGRICVSSPAAHRRRPGRRRLCRRDHPGYGQDGRQGQGDRCGLDAGSHASKRTRATAPRPRSRTSRSYSRSAGPTTSSPPAMHRNSATAPRLVS